MVKAEKAFKWGIAIIVIFGILNAFYFLNIVIGLKLHLPFFLVFLLGFIYFNFARVVDWQLSEAWGISLPLVRVQAHSCLKLRIS